VLPDTGPRWPLARLEDGGYRVDDPVTGHTRHFTRPSHDGVCLLARITDRNHHTITFDYDEHGTPVAVRHSGGYHLKLATDEGRVTALSLAGAAEDGADVVIKRYAYTDGNLTETVNSSGQPLKFTYDERLRVTSWTDTNNSRYAYTYDDRDRCIARACVVTGRRGLRPRIADITEKAFIHGNPELMPIAMPNDCAGAEPRWKSCRSGSVRVTSRT
jgi:YD repeat-containing protein